MCGIAGGWWKQSPDNLKTRAERSLEIMHNRGPDDQGFNIYRTSAGELVIGHTRLSIIDLSSAGHQPMISKDGRYVLVLNGEIYNYRELRQELKDIGCAFISDSDTEVLLYVWIHWGAACLKRIIGMFAFVIYDRQELTLTCVRDAFGIKPFLYDLNGQRFVFASELGALLALREEKVKPDLQRGYDYLVHGAYDDEEQAFVEGVKHLRPGQILVVDLKTSGSGLPRTWWQPDFRPTSSLSFVQAAAAVRESFLESVRLHLRSDVPLGAAISGGIDSSAIVCAMRYIESDLPINTFSYIAPGFDLSEEKWVDKINGFIGARAHKVQATGTDLARNLDSMIKAQGEPFGSTSIFAQYLVFKLARENGITVTLDGQGADELLAGYDGYPGQRLLSLLEQGKIFAAHRFARNWADWPGRNYKLAWMHLGRIKLSDYWFKKARKIIMGRDYAPAWLKIDMLRDAGVQFMEKRAPLSSVAKGRRVAEELARSLHHRGLPELLRHGDRNSMCHSIESRVPFLTLPLADLLLSLPEHYLISDSGETKSVFRAAMKDIVPDDILKRKDKIGFTTPEGEWLLGMSSIVREWLQDSEHIPFLNREPMLKNFNDVVNANKLVNCQIWRWINYIRWYLQMGMRT